MSSFTPIEAISRGERLLDYTAHRLAQSLPSPDDIAALLKARQQVAAGVKLSHTEDDLNKKILDVLG